MNERILAAILIVLSFLVSLFYLLKRDWRFRSALLASYFIATTIDIMLNALGLSTAFAYIVVYKKLELGGRLILYRIPVIASTIIILKVVGLFLASYIYEVVKDSLPVWLQEVMHVEKERI